MIQNYSITQLKWAPHSCSFVAAFIILTILNTGNCSLSLWLLLSPHPITQLNVQVFGL